LVGQGATEYLVLLAIVLIVALVSVALLGFFPGMASDAQITQSQMYWRSASPIAVIDASTKFYSDSGGQLACPHVVIMNTGAYPIRLSKMLGGGTSISQYRERATLAAHNFTDIYLAPGEDACFSGGYPGCVSCSDHEIYFATSSSYSPTYLVLPGAATICNNGSTGQLLVKGFGFEYIETIDGQQITKRQVGSKDFLVKCG